MDYAEKIIFVAALIVTAITLIIGIRLSLAATRTARDRAKIINILKRENRVLEFKHDLEVDFVEHQIAVAEFKNPWGLYSVKYINFLYTHEVIDMKTWEEARKVASAREKQALDLLMNESVLGSDTLNELTREDCLAHEHRHHRLSYTQQLNRKN